MDYTQYMLTFDDLSRASEGLVDIRDLVGALSNFKFPEWWVRAITSEAVHHRLLTQVKPSFVKKAWSWDDFDLRETLESDLG